MENTKCSKIKDDYGNEYNVTFFYGKLPSSTVAKELASLYNMDKKYSTIDGDSISPKESEQDERMR